MIAVKPLIFLPLRHFDRRQNNQHAMWIRLWILWKTLLETERLSVDIVDNSVDNPWIN